jgi:hypothetical protein
MISLVTNEKSDLSYLLKQTCRPITIGGFSVFLNEKDASVPITFVLQKPHEIIFQNNNDILEYTKICKSKQIVNFNNMIIFQNTIPLDFLNIYRNKLL